MRRRHGLLFLFLLFSFTWRNTDKTWPRNPQKKGFYMFLWVSALKQRPRAVTPTALQLRKFVAVLDQSFQWWFHHRKFVGDSSIEYAGCKKNMSNHQSVQCILLPIPWLPMLKRGLQFPLSKLATRALRRFARFSTARLASLLTRNRPSATPRRLVVFQLRSSRFSGNEHCILSYEKMWRIYGWILKSPDWLLIIYNC